MQNLLNKILMYVRMHHKKTCEGVKYNMIEICDSTCLCMFLTAFRLKKCVIKSYKKIQRCQNLLFFTTQEMCEKAVKNCCLQ